VGLGRGIEWHSLAHSEKGGKVKDEKTYELPEDLAVFNANWVSVSHSQAELIMDFWQVLPNLEPKPQVRVVMAVQVAKSLSEALDENLSRFEAKYGELPSEGGPGLWSDLFRDVS